MRSGTLFWGFIFLFLGTLLLLQQLDVYHVDWLFIFKMWPALLILLGIFVLPIKDWIKLIAAAIVLVATVVLTPTQEAPERLREKVTTEDSRYFNEEMSGSVDHAIFDLEAVAGRYEVSGDATELVEVVTEGRGSQFSFRRKDTEGIPHLSLNVDADEVTLLDQDDQLGAQVALNPQPVWVLNIDAEASSTELDLAELKITELDIDVDAASTKIRLGANTEQTEVTLKADAAEVRLEVPEVAGVKIITEGNLNSRKFHGFEQQEDRVWITENWQEAEQRIIIRANTNVSSLRVSRY